jgi:hypothetical protein
VPRAMVAGVEEEKLRAMICARARDTLIDCVATSSIGRQASAAKPIGRQASAAKPIGATVDAMETTRARSIEND